MSEWKLEGNKARLIVQVLSYERESAADESDANWLSCRVEGALAMFSCREEYSITTSDLSEFEASLRGMLEGRSTKASFATMEEGFGFEIELNSRGQSTVSGFMSSSGMPRVKMDFVFQSDQSYLQQSLSDLSHVNEQFPKRVIHK